MLAAVVVDDTGLVLQRLADDGTVLGPPRPATPADLRAVEAADTPRWIFSSTSALYPALLGQGVEVDRSHDISLTERILLGRAGRFGEPLSAAAVRARADGLAVPDDPAASAPGIEPTLFDDGAGAAPAAQQLAVLRTAALNQMARIGTDNALRLLVAAESASGLAAAEMGRWGLPWRADVHDRLLTELLGPRPAPGRRPARLEALAERITTLFGRPVNPDSPNDVREAFNRAGYSIESTRAWVLRELDHPAVPDVLAYKELSRLFAANGWNWLADWVRDGRFKADYQPGGVVSGRWATRGGGALQIPRAIRSAVVAEPGYRLVVADAAQLEPRVLAAVSRDPALTAVAAAGDLYDAVAADGFGGDRAHAKVAMLGAMYGATTGEAGRLLAVLRTRYPEAMGWVETAARQGERGESVRSVLGRASPPPTERWWQAVDAGNQPDASETAERRGRQVARDWGRFTRNFVVQASASDWASVWLSGVRRDLRALSAGAELVFFQHDELMVHVPETAAAAVAELTVAAADAARDLVFPGSTVLTPVRPDIVECYADAK